VIWKKHVYPQQPASVMLATGKQKETKTTQLFNHAENQGCASYG